MHLRCILVILLYQDAVTMLSSRTSTPVPFPTPGVDAGRSALKTSPRKFVIAAGETTAHISCYVVFSVVVILNIIVCLYCYA